MSDGSPSINDLLKDKREQEPVSPNLTPEKAGQSAASEVQPVTEPAPEKSREIPHTLEENIIGKEQEKLAETESPQSRPAAVQNLVGSRGKSSSATPAVTEVDLKNIKGLSQEEQVKVLTEIVLTDGLDKAIAVVKRLDNPYLYDLLHDTLVDELYQRLKGPKVK